MGKLTTHVLDIAAGLPARGLKLRLFRLDARQRELLCERQTNAEGRCDAPLLAGTEFAPGRYELEFDAGDYFDALAARAPVPEQRFIDVVPIRFTIADAEQSYHVPLVVSPFAYSTYRGS